MGITERKEREKEQRRQDIIDAAEKVFFKKGYDTATVDEVAEVAELSKGTIYLYFNGKEDLFHAVFMRGMNILSDMLVNCCKDKLTGYEMLVAMGLTFIRFSKEQANYFSLFPLHEGTVHQNLSIGEAEFKRQVLEESPLPKVLHCVELGIKDGSLRNDIPASKLASTLWSQMLGLIVTANNKADIYEFFGVTVEDIFLTHLEIVSNGCKKK